MSLSCPLFVEALFWKMWSLILAVCLNEHGQVTWTQHSISAVKVSSIYITQHHTSHMALNPVQHIRLVDGDTWKSPLWKMFLATTSNIMLREVKKNETIGIFIVHKHAVFGERNERRRGGGSLLLTHRQCIYWHQSACWLWPPGKLHPDSSPLQQHPPVRQTQCCYSACHCTNVHYFLVIFIIFPSNKPTLSYILTEIKLQWMLHWPMLLSIFCIHSVREKGN